MAISLKHTFTSPKADGTDSTLVQPSNWNAEHQLQMATARLVGRTTTGAGAAEEISVGANLSFTGLTLNLASSVSITALTASGAITGGSLSISGDADFTGTGAIKVPVGTTAQRPTPATGDLRFNSTLTAFEGYNGSNWSPVGGVLDPENRIINGAFDFWQRGTSFTASGYLADRWNVILSGGTVTTSRQAFTLGDTLGSNSPTYFLRQTVSGQSATSHYGLFRQPIEGVRSYAGKTVTVLGWARRSSGSGNMAVSVDQNFGTGGSPSSQAQSAGQTVTLTSSWAAFAVTFVVPSISGKTLGSNGNDCFTINFWTSAGSDYNARTNSLDLQTIGVDLWGIHIKQGTHTTSAVDLYRQPELGAELARCQRYYEKSYDVNVVPGTNTKAGVFSSTANNYSSGVALYANTIFYKTNKRAVPALSFWAYDGTANQWHESVAGFSETLHAAPLLIGSGTGSITPYMTTTAANANYMYGHWVADAEL